MAILYRNAANLKIEQTRITDGANGFSHQAVSWTIRSPLIANPIHITGVYVSPSEGEVEIFFTHGPNKITTPPMKFTSMQVTSMRTSLTNSNST